MFINHAAKQVTAKIVYYGPGLSGKTSNLQYIFSITNPKSRGELVSIETDIERTLFFDLLPINVGLIKGYQAKFQLYTVPGQIFYDATRKLVLKGADGVVFVADSQELMGQANTQSLENLKVNLAGCGKNIEEIPLVFQYNKRDLGSIIPINVLNQTLNETNAPYFEAVATKGTGVIETLREISGKTLGLIKAAIYSQKDMAASVSSPVQFDTNTSQEIIEKDELPMRKFAMDSMDELKTRPLPEVKDIHEQPSPAGAKAPEPANGKGDDAALRSIREMAAQFLNAGEDRSRLTLIQKLPVNGSQLTVDIRNSEDSIIQSIDLDLDPETRKVTLVFDLKR